MKNLVEITTNENFTEEEKALFKRAKKKFGVMSVYALLELYTKYDKAKENGEEWASKYCVRADFLRDVLYNAEKLAINSFVDEKGCKRLFSIKSPEDLM